MIEDVNYYFNPGKYFRFRITSNKRFIGSNDMGLLYTPHTNNKRIWFGLPNIGKYKLYKVLTPN